MHFGKVQEFFLELLQLHRSQLPYNLVIILTPGNSDVVSNRILALFLNNMLRHLHTTFIQLVQKVFVESHISLGRHRIFRFLSLS
jgi:hypothetical protein